jgi:hypothetical protein
MMQRVPEEQIILRFLQTVDRKREQWRRHVRAGRVAADDVFVIALNAAHAQRPILPNAQRFAVKALFALGDLVAVFDKSLRKTVEVFHEARPNLTRANGRSMSSSLFADDRASEVSAVLCSDFHLGQLLLAPYPGIRAKLVCAHNPFARAPLPERCLGAADEYVATQDGPDRLLLQRLSPLG